MDAEEREQEKIKRLKRHTASYKKKKEKQFKKKKIKKFWKSSDRYNIQKEIQKELCDGSDF